MTLKSIFSRFARRKSESMPVISDNHAAETWHYLVAAEPARLVRKVELCTALAAGHDAWDEPVDKDHLHTFLMVTLVPILGLPDDIYLIERVLSTGGAYHSVIPIEEGLSKGGSLFHPDVHDRICIVPDAQAKTLTHHLEVERTLVFGDGPSLTLSEFAHIVAFMSRTTMLICAGGDCKFQSRAFAFMCMSTLTPTLPPVVKVRERVGMNSKTDMMGDLVFENLSASFLEEVFPLMVREREALRVMYPLKGELWGRAVGGDC